MTMLASPNVTVPYEMLDIPVRGGNLRLGSWGTGEVTVLAVHGLTLTHAEFHLLGECLANSPGDPLRLVAPDLRGRSGSAALPAPYGLEAHVEDVAAVLKHLHGAPVVLVGHSWGAVVALAVAHCHPALVRSLLLVDGGLPPPRGPASEQGAQRASERVLARLAKTFSSVEAYLDTWRGQAGLGLYWNEHIERTFTYELWGEPPELRCSLKAEAFLADMETTYAQDSLAERAMTGLAHRATLIRSARNMADEDHPQYSDAVARSWCGQIAGLRDHIAQGENHYTILLGESGTTVVADFIRGELRIS
jgi:pimeloyl-ACP methyl ester carboxylesterase